MPRYRHVHAKGFNFVFAYDEDEPELLRIFARHGTTVDDAFRIWFNPSLEEVWDNTHQRFEVQSETHILLWKWLTQGERVLIITCMTREDRDDDK